MAPHQGPRLNELPVGYSIFRTTSGSRVVGSMVQGLTKACHGDESSGCETARQHKVAEGACHRLERTLMGCADPPSKGVGAPHQCSRVNRKRSGWDEFVTYPSDSMLVVGFEACSIITPVGLCFHFNVFKNVLTFETVPRTLPASGDPGWYSISFVKSNLP